MQLLKMRIEAPIQIYYYLVYKRSSFFFFLDSHCLYHPLGCTSCSGVTTEQLLRLQSLQQASKSSCFSIPVFSPSLWKQKLHVGKWGKKNTTKQTSVVKKRGNDQYLKHDSPVTTSLLLTFSLEKAVLWPRLHHSIIKTLDNATSMFAILSEMMASVTSASGLNSQNMFLKILIFYLQITKVKKKLSWQHRFKPHNARSLCLLPFSINILSVPLSLEEVVPWGNRTIYHQKAEYLLTLIDDNFPLAAGTLPSEASERLLGTASAAPLCCSPGSAEVVDLLLVQRALQTSQRGEKTN